MTTTNDITEADRALKAKHRAMWALGDYPAVARDLVGDLGPILVAGQRRRPGRAGARRGRRVRQRRIPAAAAGASVVASDLTPELFDDRPQGSPPSAGVEIDWQQADAEALPYPDASFDTVLSCVGVMFAPHHQAGADELVRVLRPGGTIGLLSWTPEGFIGQMFATMKPYAPPPPPGAQPPPLWGDEEHVRALLGDRVTEVSASRASLSSTSSRRRPTSATTSRPTTARPSRSTGSIADDPEKVAALDRELEELGRPLDRGDGSTCSTGSTCCSPASAPPDAPPFDHVWQACGYFARHLRLAKYSYACHTWSTATGAAAGGRLAAGDVVRHVVAVVAAACRGSGWRRTRWRARVGAQRPAEVHSWARSYSRSSPGSGRPGLLGSRHGCLRTPAVACPHPDPSRGVCQGAGQPDCAASTLARTSSGPSRRGAGRRAASRRPRCARRGT